MGDGTDIEKQNEIPMDCCEGGCAATFKRELLFPQYDSPLDVNKMETSWPKIFVCAMQHCAAVIFTVTLVPMITMGIPGYKVNSTTDFGPGDKSFVVSQSLMMAGVSTLIQSLKIGPVGSNLLSVMGCSFAFLSACIMSGNLAKVYGMSMATAFFEPLLIYLIPAWVMKRIFPPWMLGLAIMLIGFGLCGVGISDWRGDGSTRDFGIGLWSFASMVFIYRIPQGCIGSWFRSLSVLIAITSGYIFAACLGSINTKPIEIAEWWIWPHPCKFGIEFDSSLFLPFLIAVFISTLESIGDISATSALSGKVIEGNEFTRRLRGGLNADAIGSFFSSIFCSFPNTTYSENNGLVAITDVSDYRVGVVFGCYMIVLGFFGKFAGIFLSIPTPVLGGVLTILFCMIAVSGFKFVIDDLRCRRTQFILACSLGIGMGISMAYNSHAMGHYANCSYTLGNPNTIPVIKDGKIAYELAPGIEGIKDGTSRSILDSGLTMGVMVAFFMNLLIPYGYLGFEEMSFKAQKEKRTESKTNVLDDNVVGGTQIELVDGAENVKEMQSGTNAADDIDGQIELPETKESNQLYDLHSTEAKRTPELGAE